VIRGLLVLAALLAPAGASAHGLDPAALALLERSTGVFEVEWRTSALRTPGADVQPVLPARCRRIATEAPEVGADHVMLRWTVDCGPASLTGEEIRVTDLDAAKINALVTIMRADGSDVQRVLGPRQGSFVVPAQPTWTDVGRGYATLGIEHILGGPDHLLFVFGLMLLVAGSGTLVRTVTAFTLGHSVTLSAAALGFASVPSRPVEALIAFSILVLAVELARGETAGTLLRRRPWVMAFTFGLLHGFGFAGALAEAGLPRGDVPLALLSFNVGIEIGQLAFVLVVLAAGRVVARRSAGLARRAVPGAVYAMGILAAFWWIERMAAWLA